MSSETSENVNSKKNSPTSKRRVLGDITNAYAGNDDAKDKGIKKTVFTSVSSSMNTFRNTDNVAIDTARSMTTEIDTDRTYMLRPSDDIDARDVDNPLLCTAMVNEMYEHFGQLERKMMINPEYMTTHQYINEKMRTILIDWLVEVHLKFKMVPETLYLAVNIIDRFLEKKQVKRSKLQLVGVSALLLSAKYEEIYPPELRDLVYITDRAYTKHEIVETESEIVKLLDFNLTVPTIHSFLCRFLKAAHADRTMVQLSCYLAERCLQEMSIVKWLPSQIAASAVLIARKSLKRHPWSPTLVKYTKYDEVDIVGCVKQMEKLICDNTAQQQAVFRKYSSTKFGGVAKLPLSF
jgi:cyclin B